MKTIVFILSIYLLTGLSGLGQNKDTDAAKSITQETLKQGQLSPYLFLSQITSNPSTNNLEVNLTDTKFKLHGVLYEGRKKGNIANIKLEGANENKTVNIFSGTNLNPKFIGEVSWTYPISKWVSYTLPAGATQAQIQNKTFNTIVNQPTVYGTKRLNMLFITAGLSGEGAKYNLFDSTANFSDMINTEKYSGWQVYLQGYMINYNFKHKRSVVQSVKYTYGEVNNVSDLTEHTIRQSSAFSSPPNAISVSRSITGYYDNYQKQHRGVLSYELSSYYLDPSSKKVGFLVGADMIFNEKEANYPRLNIGGNFPVKYGQDNRVYIAAILSSTDPTNQMKIVHFDFSGTLSFSLRVATKLNLKFGSN